MRNSSRAALLTICICSLAACGASTSVATFQELRTDFSDVSEKVRLSSPASAELLPMSGSAEFHGVAAVEIHQFTDPRRPTRLLGASEYEVDFEDATISGGITNFSMGDFTTVPGRVVFEIGAISQGVISGRMVGQIDSIVRNDPVGDDAKFDFPVTGVFFGENATLLGLLGEGTMAGGARISIVDVAER